MEHSYRIQSNPFHGWIQSMSNSEGGLYTEDTLKSEHKAMFPTEQ